MSRPRIRSIKPERWQEEELGSVSRDARLLWVVLTTMADDDGRLRGMPAAIIGHGYPYDDDVTPAKVRRWLDELDGVGLVVRYEVDGRPYIWLTDFSVHQQVNRPSPSQLPQPPVTTRSRTGAHRLSELSVNGHGERTDDSSASRAPADRIGSVSTSLSSVPSDESGEGEPREDVARLTRLLADLMRQNNEKAKVAPTSKGWTDPIRLLLDRDGHDAEHVERVIRWCQADDFWRTNILSPSKLRKQFDQLTLKMGAAGVREAVERSTSSAQLGAAWRGE